MKSDYVLFLRFVLFKIPCYCVFSWLYSVILKVLIETLKVFINNNKNTYGILDE